MFYDSIIELFKHKLYETIWDNIEVFQNPDETCKIFLNKFFDLHDAYLIYSDGPKEPIK